MSEGFSSIGERLYAALIESDRYMAYLRGFGQTLEVSLFAVCIGVIVGTLIAIIKVTAHQNRGLRFLEWISNIYITIIRGTPVYVQLLILWFMVFTSRNSSPILAASLGFGINSSAYVAEIVRAGIMAVDKGQTEAGRSLGLNGTMTMRYIILPQAIKNILPALGNEFIVLIKETSIMGFMSVTDVTKVAQNIGNITYDYLLPLFIAALMYLVVVVGLTKLLAIFERRLAQSDKR